eukprot:scaffold6469_cov99-Skeletonema_dohrnii-CCMP3373.AAC.3
MIAIERQIASEFSTIGSPWYSGNPVLTYMYLSLMTFVSSHGQSAKTASFIEIFHTLSML